MGVERAVDAVTDADLVLLVVDDRDAADDVDPCASGPRRRTASIVVRNKIDLSGAEPGLVVDGRDVWRRGCPALEGTGLAELEEAIVRRVMRGAPASEDAFMARRRHLEALERALAALDRAQSGSRRTMPASSSPKSCATRRTLSVRSPERLRPRTCLRTSSRASVSGSESARA